jgi:hypothetical protein
MVFENVASPSGQTYSISIKKTGRLAEASDEARYMLYNIVFR